MGILTRAGRLAPALLLTGLATGCESTVEPLDDFALVHAVLMAGADSARIRLDRVEPENAIRYSLDDALVTLETPSETLPLPWVAGLPCIDTIILPHDGEAGCYEEALPAPVAPGGEYSFVARLAEGGEVLGRTVVPPPPAIRLLEEPWLRYPLPHPFVPVRLVWEAGPVVGRVEARLRLLRARERGGTWQTARCRLALEEDFVHDPREGPAEIRIRDIGCDFDWDSMAVEMRTTAYDTAYARYVRIAGPSSLGVSAELASAGLEGALGLFGSAVIVVDTLFIQRESLD